MNYEVLARSCRHDVDMVRPGGGLVIVAKTLAPVRSPGHIQDTKSITNHTCCQLLCFTLTLFDRLFFIGTYFIIYFCV